MDAGIQSLKNVSKIALAALLVLLIGAFVFFKERVFFADTAFVLFNILNYHSFAIQEYRYGSFITQLVPYLGQLMHLPVRALVVAYSAGFNVFYFVAATIIVYRFRQYRLAILLAMYYFLFVSQSYFWVSNEIQQAVAWMFLLCGATLYYSNRMLKSLWIAATFSVLVFLTVFTHFIVIIPLVFLLVYLWLDRRLWPFTGRQALVPTGILLAIVGIKFAWSIFHPSWDNFHLHGLTHFSIKDVIQSFSRPVVTVFLQRCLNIYWPAVIILISGLGILIYTKQWKQASWVVLCTLGYIIIIGLTYSGDIDGDIQLYHIESEWQCLGIIIATPFVFAVLPSLKTNVASIILIVFFLVRLFYIWEAAPLFLWRSHFQEQVLAQMKTKRITKLAIVREDSLMTAYRVDWASGYESTLMSAMNGDVPQSTFIFIDKNDKEKVSKLADPKVVYLWDVTQVSAINPGYFSFDSMQAYRILAYTELMSNK